MITVSEFMGKTIQSSKYEIFNHSFITFFALRAEKLVHLTYELFVFN